MNTLLDKNKTIATKEGLTDYFKSGFKTTQNLGLEYEKLPINKDLKATEFFFRNGILDFLTLYKNQEHLIPHFENDTMLGLISNKGSISLEPGCQVELSLKPFQNIKDIENELTLYNKKTALIGKQAGIKFLGLGNQPLSDFSNIKIIPKKRYEFMTKYLIEQASLPYEMMRETAGIQVSIDYQNEEDAIKKLSCALKLSPFLSAMFSNSPIRKGKLTEYKSNRMNAWLNTDNRRCGLIDKRLFEQNTDFSFSDYVDILLNVPMIFHQKQYFADKTFKEYFNEEKTVSEQDWETHISLFFPDVRLKNYIEIRNHDCQLPKYALSIPALYKGIIYSKTGIDEVNNLLKDFKYYDYEFIRHNAPRFGIDFSVNNVYIADILKEIFAIARKGLKESNMNEEKYLDSVEELLNDNMTPADVIIKNFNGSWNKNLKKLVEFSEIK